MCRSIPRGQAQGAGGGGAAAPVAGGGEGGISVGAAPVRANVHVLLKTGKAGELISTLTLDPPFDVTSVLLPIVRCPRVRGAGVSIDSNKWQIKILHDRASVGQFVMLDDDSLSLAIGSLPSSVLLTICLPLNDPAAPATGGRGYSRSGPRPGAAAAARATAARSLWTACVSAPAASRFWGHRVGATALPREAARRRGAPAPRGARPESDSDSDGEDDAARASSAFWDRAPGSRASWPESSSIAIALCRRSRSILGPFCIIQSCVS